MELNLAKQKLALKIRGQFWVMAIKKLAPQLKPQKVHTNDVNQCL